MLRPINLEHLFQRLELPNWNFCELVLHVVASNCQIQLNIVSHSNSFI